MQFYLSLLIAVIVLGTLSRNLKQRWLGVQEPLSGAAEDQATGLNPAALGATTTASFQAPIDRMAQELSTLRDKLTFGSKGPDLSQRFRTWAAAALAHDGQVSAWLTGLSPEAHTAFTHQVAEFCSEMGFALAALVDGQLAEIPATAQQAETIVLQYCRANQQAALAQDDFDAAKRFLAYLRAPSHKSNLAFGQKLYSRLIEEKIVPPPSFDMMLAAEEKRRAEGVAAIHQAAAQQPTIFNIILKEIITTSASLPTTEVSQLRSAETSAVTDTDTGSHAVVHAVTDEATMANNRPLAAAMDLN